MRTGRIAVILVGVMLVSGSVQAEKWVVLLDPRDPSGKTPFSMGLSFTSVDAENLRVLSDSTVVVWIKEEPWDSTLDKWRIERIVSREKDDLPTKGWHLYAKQLTQVCYDCENKRYRLMQIIDYDINGKVIDFWVYTEQKWNMTDEMPPGSIGECLTKTICALRRVRMQQSRGERP